MFNHKFLLKFANMYNHILRRCLTKNYWNCSRKDNNLFYKNSLSYTTIYDVDFYPNIFEINQEKTAILYKQIWLQFMKKYIVQKIFLFHSQIE